MLDLRSGMSLTEKHTVFSYKISYGLHSLQRNRRVFGQRRKILTVNRSGNGYKWQSNMSSKWNQEQRFLKRKWRERAPQKKFGTSALLPLLLGLAFASMLGPLVLAFVVGIAGIGFSMIMGLTAIAFLFPILLLGTLGMSVFFGALQFAFAIPLILGVSGLAFAFTKWVLRREIESEIPKKQQKLDQKEHQWQLDERETERLSRQELFDFDEKLKKRTDPNAL